MKILRFDSIGGASGDMILGALLGLGVDAAWVEKQLADFLPDPFHIETKPHESCGLNGVQTRVHIGGHHAHEHHRHEHDHEHRSFRVIRDMISNSRLDPKVKELSIRVFQRLAEAEGAVHRKPAEDVHFHEVGATDSIVDIVGSCLACVKLGIDAVSVDRLPLSSGSVTCQHGVYPLPAPATLELLKGFSVEQTEESVEMVTPTGAALLMSWRSEQAPARGRILQSVNSFGHHHLHHRPNVLRATMMESEAPAASGPECLVMETNLDDMTPELIGTLMDALLHAGALDVFTTPVQMKKNRPGMLLTVLCEASRADVLKNIIFTESTTFGIRQYAVERTVLARRTVEVETEYGRIRVKIGTWKGSDVTRSPEMDDCAAAARAHNVPVRKVYEAASRL
ncbi:MAG TPA: nickel pincer cofactor biosynthesis protein LarC [Kiritimatiellia bacterium]|nr:nickel pincer cofactor biosynthesis protein LarC [Kiritimatiellia bacterium]HNS81415.1 nickel pincer cofactor biosynthesis protein LarC [Kiritimatiellia bacterium]